MSFTLYLIYLFTNDCNKLQSRLLHDTMHLSSNNIIFMVDILAHAHAHVQPINYLLSAIKACHSCFHPYFVCGTEQSTVKT